MKLLEQNYVKYGLIMCLLLTICLAMLYAAGEDFESKTPLQMLFTVVAPMIVWFLGINAKKKQLKNKLTFKQGFHEGFKISLVFAVVSPFIFGLFYLINPALLEYVKRLYQMTDASNEMVILLDMAAQFFSAIIFGSIYAAVVALFLKTKKK